MNFACWSIIGCHWPLRLGCRVAESFHFASNQSSAGILSPLPLSSLISPQKMLLVRRTSSNAWRLGETAWPSNCSPLISYLVQGQRKPPNCTPFAVLASCIERYGMDLSKLLQICHLWGTASQGQLFTVHGRIGSLALVHRQMITTMIAGILASLSRWASPDP